MRGSNGGNTESTLFGVYTHSWFVQEVIKNWPVGEGIHLPPVHEYKTKTMRFQTFSTKWYIGGLNALSIRQMRRGGGGGFVWPPSTWLVSHFAQLCIGQTSILIFAVFSIVIILTKMSIFSVPSKSSVLIRYPAWTQVFKSLRWRWSPGAWSRTKETHLDSNFNYHFLSVLIWVVVSCHAQMLLFLKVGLILKCSLHGTSIEFCYVKYGFLFKN